MAYNKYYLQKKQVSYDNGLTWEDVTPSETRQGAYIDSYQTLAECEGIIDYSTQYLTIESKSNNNLISWKANNTGLTKTISASTDNGNTWTSYTSTTGGTTIATLNSGDTILLKGLNGQYGNGDGKFNYFTTSGNFNVYGNIMSLTSGDSFENASLTNAYTFRNLFSSSSGLTSAENLVLPSTSLTNSCFYAMFYGCTGLTTAPVLSATTLEYGCYWHMFNGCRSLTVAPELPATTLANFCYGSMFYGCSSLTTAPVLSATTLAQNCYYQMFYNCTSLNYIKCLATYISATNCTYYWVNGVSSTGTFVKDANTTWSTGVNGIPDGWTVQNNS